MNIYEKIQIVKQEFLKKNIKKSGQNKFANYTYYELADITPELIELCNTHKLFTGFSFDKELATLTVINIEQPKETVVYTSPMEELEIKGANKIQALGGTETYQRRYLYMAAFDIIENDMFDAVVNDEPKADPKATDKQIEMIKKLLSDDEVNKMLEFYKIKTINDLTINQASATIKKRSK